MSCQDPRRPVDGVLAASGGLTHDVMHVVVSNGLNSYTFRFTGPLCVGTLKDAIYGEIPVARNQMLLYYNGVPLTDDNFDLRRYHQPPSWLYLRVLVSIFTHHVAATAH